jgi:hypothetical protein
LDKLRKLAFEKRYVARDPVKGRIQVEQESKDEFGNKVKEKHEKKVD